MSRAEPERFRSRSRGRKIRGALFGLACLVATLTGVFVLAVLLGAVVRGALERPPSDGEGPTTSIGIAELPGFLATLADRFQSVHPERAGFKAGLAGSLQLLAMVALFSIPVGVGAAVSLEEFAPPGLWKRVVQTNIANLAGVPSIVYGILGLALFTRGFGLRRFALGPSLVGGGLTLALLVLPIIVIATQEALRAVPSSLRQAALALGATRWQVVRDHVLPGAAPGILTGTILALSRAIGETAPLLLVGAAGSILFVPRGPFSRYTALPVEIYNYAAESDAAYRSIACGGILILLALLLGMNAVAIVIRNRSDRHRR